MSGEGETPWWATVLGLLLMLAVCAGLGRCKQWEYNECIAVGHTSNYCAAQVAGCFDKR